MKGAESEKGHPAGGKVIYLVGEGTGETISKIARASLPQFRREEIHVKTFFMVKDRQQVVSITRQAAEDGALIAFSMVEPNMRDALIREAAERGLKAIDVIGDFIAHLSIFLGEKPLSIPGRQYILDEDYFSRIEAINFTVKHDDGKYPHGLKLTDMVLVGLSRTGKTPLSIYLATQGWKVANIPLHQEMLPPEELFEVDHRKVFGLVINPRGLVRLRRARLEQLGLTPDAKYADLGHVTGEVQWCKAFFGQNPRWKLIDVSNRAIEEVSASIVNAYRKEMNRA